MRPALVPGERRVVTSDGVELYVKVAGRGPVCLFVHGGPGQGSLSFEKMGGDVLESFLTMIYLDQRGSGKSQGGRDYCLERVMQDLEEVRRSLDQDQLCLIAHSFGGVLAVNYARRHPQHVSKLILANATLQFLSPEQGRMQIAFANQLLGRRIVTVAADAGAAAIDTARGEARSAVMRSGNGYRFLTERVETIQVMTALDQSYPRARDFGRAVIEGRNTLPEYYADYAPETASLDLPVLVITGTRDYAVGPDEHKRFRFPHQRTVTLDGGHLPYYESTVAFAGAIRELMTDRRR